MNVEVLVVFEDGKSELDCEMATFEEAVRYALRCADAHGFTKGDGHGPPKWVQVALDGDVQLSIRVLRGGLTAPEEDRTLHST